MPEKDPSPISEPGRDSADALNRSWEAAGRLPCTLSVELPVTGFTIGALVGLGAGSIISAGWPLANPVPVWVNGVTIGRAEFAPAGNHLAVRITELC